MSRGAVAKAFLRLLLYLAIALGFLVAVGGLGVYMARTGLRVPPFRWVEFIGTTPIIFWIVIKRLRNLWHHARFWLTAGALLVVHVLVFTEVLVNCPWWPPVWLVPIFVIETPFLFLALDKFGAHHAR